MNLRPQDLWSTNLSFPRYRPAFCHPTFCHSLVYSSSPSTLVHLHIVCWARLILGFFLESIRWSLRNAPTRLHCSVVESQGLFSQFGSSTAGAAIPTSLMGSQHWTTEPSFYMPSSLSASKALWDFPASPTIKRKPKDRGFCFYTKCLNYLLTNFPTFDHY